VFIVWKLSRPLPETEEGLNPSIGLALHGREVMAPTDPPDEEIA
jgi:hypothetical protein